jgi:hypothetical protein
VLRTRAADRLPLGMRGATPEMLVDRRLESWSKHGTADATGSTESLPAVRAYRWALRRTIHDLQTARPLTG